MSRLESEGHCYRMRVDRFLVEKRPEFEPDDAQLFLDLYRNADPEDEFDHFEEQRETNVEFEWHAVRARGSARRGPANTAMEEATPVSG